MKKAYITSAIALALFGMQASAATETEEGWVGVNGIFYDVNQDREMPNGNHEEGLGLGVEAGFRFKPNWAIRGELSFFELEDEVLGDQAAKLFGADAMYFLNDDIAYLFSGYKILDVNRRYHLVNAGVGKHWDIGENFALITEVAAYYDFNDSYRDYSVKLGFAYKFGNVNHSSAAAETPMLTASNVDSDNDGVIDDNDQCPGTPANSKVDNNGCAMVMASTAVEGDADKDGVKDSADKCPNTPTKDVVDSEGCSRFGEKVVTETVSVTFANNSSVITNKDAQEIVDFANFMKRYGKVDAVIEGHSSAPGDADYNLMLSEKRANAFLDLLVDEYGISRSRLKAVGYGETQLLDTRDTPAAHKTNRRIAVTVSETIKVKLTK